MDYFVSFDVESNGLHGRGFAFGAVAFKCGIEIDSAFAWCDPRDIERDVDEWVRANVVPVLIGNPSVPLHVVQNLFAEFYYKHKRAGAVLVADCPWPVEARFLAKLIDEDTIGRGDGPYPFIDVASVRLAAGLDPLETCERLPGELPAHNPLADARQSARLLLEAMRLGVRP